MRGVFLAIEKRLGLVAQVFLGLSGLALTAIVGLIVASVVMRRVVGSPLFYTEEMVGLLLCAALFLALPMVTVRAQHVRVTFLAQVMGRGGRRVLVAAGGLVTLMFCVWYVWEALPWLEFAIQRGIRTEAAGLRLWPYMAVPPLSVALCALLVLVRLVSGSEADALVTDGNNSGA
jgi:TRAP-type C4-dicarboxylate transport system permease small subunit